MMEPDEHGITEVFSEALNAALKHSPPHVAFESAAFAARSYLAARDAIDLSSKGSGPQYKLVLKKAGQERR